MITENEYNQAVETIKKYWMQNPDIESKEFVEWREKYFKVGIRIETHQSVTSGRRYAHKELIKKFKKSRSLNN